MGGTLAFYAQRGVAVHLICATRGEAGDVDEPYLQGFRSKAERRESELRCAAMKLGLAGVQFLGYRDSGMPGTPDNQHPQALINAPSEQVAAQVAHAIRELRPQVVLTFDPIGGYKHPDHIAIHKATVRAFDLAGQAGYQDGLPPYQPEKLYFHVIPKGYLRLAVRLMPLFGRDPRHFGRNGDVDLTSLVKDGDFPIHAVIDYTPAARAKDDATQCHESQLGGPSLRRGPMHWARVLFGQKEHFMRAYPPPKNGRREMDLFANL
jgi:LmbE family N-acetylglucosaminyl deacetylase